MLLTSFTLFSPVLVLFVMGYLIVRSGYLSSHVGDILIEYLMKVPIPIVTFFAMTKFVWEDVAGSLTFVFTYTAIHFLFLFGSLLLLTLLGYPKNRSVTIASCIFFPNLVFFALPIFLSLPNHQQYMHLFVLGLIISVVIFSLIVVPLYKVDSQSLSLSVLWQSAKETLKMPLVIAVIAGVFMLVFKLHLPIFVERLMSKFGAIVGTTGVIALGMNIDVQFKQYDWSVWVAVIAKTCLMPLMTIGFVKFFRIDLSHTDFFALVIMLACPTAGIAAMTAKQLSDHPQTAFNITIGSTMLSVMLFPVWIALVNYL